MFILMAARRYIAIRYGCRNGKKTDIQKRVLESYMKFVRYGVLVDVTGASTK